MYVRADVLDGVDGFCKIELLRVAPVDTPLASTGLASLRFSCADKSREPVTSTSTNREGCYSKGPRLSEE